MFQAGLQQHTQIHFGGLLFRLFLLKCVYIATAIGREFSVQSNIAECQSLDTASVKAEFDNS